MPPRAVRVAPWFAGRAEAGIPDRSVATAGSPRPLRFAWAGSGRLCGSCGVGSLCRRSFVHGGEYRSRPMRVAARRPVGRNPHGLSDASGLVPRETQFAGRIRSRSPSGRSRAPTAREIVPVPADRGRGVLMRGPDSSHRSGEGRSGGAPARHSGPTCIRNRPRGMTGIGAVRPYCPRRHRFRDAQRSPRPTHAGGLRAGAGPRRPVHLLPSCRCPDDRASEAETA